MPHNLCDSLGLAGNSLSLRQSWEERELKKMTVQSFIADRWQQRLGWVGWVRLAWLRLACSLASG